MKVLRNAALIALLTAVLLAPLVLQEGDQPAGHQQPGHEEVVFWHFWGGEDELVVRNVVRRFNASQDRFVVRAVAMPGNNLDVKLFLAVTGGDPPDLINQDDPIIADWAERGAILPLEEIAAPDELAELDDWLFPAARRLCRYEGRLYGLCNGLDVRALYYNRTLLEQHPQLGAPRTPEDLLRLSEQLSRVDGNGRPLRFGYLPDSRRLWVWGVVFGGAFYDHQARRATVDDPPVVAALQWMAAFSQRYGPQQVAAFRQGDQQLPGSIFPLLPFSDHSPHGRYAAILDGQWRVRDIARSQRARREAGLPVAEYGVWSLPFPRGGRKDAGWVNGNFFLVPRGAKNRDGAWAFMKFWTGFRSRRAEAAQTCAAGGWIPVSQSVVDQPRFQRFLRDRPLFRHFVELASSENQFPIPVVPGAPLFDREIRYVGSRAMRDLDTSPAELLRAANRRIQAHLDRSRRD